MGLALTVGMYGMYGGLGLGGLLVAVFLIAGTVILVKKPRTGLYFSEPINSETTLLMPKRSKAGGLYDEV